MSQKGKQQECTNKEEHQNGKKYYNSNQIKNQRITRRMKKIIKKNNSPFSNLQIDQKCAICLNQCGKQSATLPCSHIFCMGCISNWWITNSTCPYCRQQFRFIFDYKGRKLLKSELPQQFLIQRQQTLKCQSCWADIGNQPMRICFQCRCVYIHKRCLLGQQIKFKIWRCEQCWQLQQQKQKKNEEIQQKRVQPAYRCSLRIDRESLLLRHSQRIVNPNLKY